jgi:thiamine-phosphate diphosphorylase
MTAIAPLPRLVVLTDRAAAHRRGRTLAETVREAVTGGCRAVLLREKDLPREDRRRLLDELRAAVEPAAGRVGVASDVRLAALAGAEWVHLASRDPTPPGPRPTILGRSCHDVTEVAAAHRDGCDYVFVSPVAASASKPGYGPAIDRHELAEACHVAVPVPVWALGGVTQANASMWCAAGATGVAVMGAIMAADDPAAATAALVQAIGNRR